MRAIKKGEVYLANLGNVKQEDIGKIRPVLIFQNDKLNRMVSEGLYDDVVVIPLSSQLRENDFTLSLPVRDNLQKESVILCNAIKMISDKRLLRDEEKVTTLTDKELKNVEEKVALLLGFKTHTH